MNSKEIEKKVADLEKQVKELEAQPKETHFHFYPPVYVAPYVPPLPMPANPPWTVLWVQTPRITCGDPILSPYTSAAGRPPVGSTTCIH